MRGWLLAILIAAGLLLANGVFTGAFGAGVALPPYVLQVLCLAGINVTLAVSLNLINGFTGQFSIGHAGFMAIGAYASSYFTVTFGPALRTSLGSLPLFVQDSVVLLVGLAIGAFLASIAGFFVGVPSLRLRGDYLAIVTLGFGEIIGVVILNIDAVGGARGYSGIPKLANFFWIWIFAAVTILIVYRIVHSSFGRTLVAIREDEVAAEAMGVHTTRAKVISFVVSSAMAGVAGGLFAHYLMYVNVRSFNFLKSFEIIIMIVIGGLGSISGSVLGAVLFISLTEGLREFAQYRMVLFSLLLIILMIVRPQGILGHKEFVTFLTRRRRSIGAAPGTTGNA
ncbi:MAG TPA: branched-chain amino acid ABC transporter permease [Thermoanaerobaculia bacterium]|nr:branched-chain amino acid ABC transporter permease [Thermoanaerobaculia bacterium]